MRYLSALTSLRFIAAAMIVVHHTHDYFGYGSALARALPMAQGVSFFFVLSGFILYYTSGSLTTLGEASRFLSARIARIWPLQAATFCLTLLFVPQPWGPGGPTLEPAVLNVLLVQGWIPLPRFFFSYNAVSWSLSAELFFYLCFPALVLNWRRTWPWKMALCAGAACFMVWAASAAQLGAYDGSDRLSIDSVVAFNPIPRLFEFALGILTADFWLRWRSRLTGLSTASATLLEAASIALLLVAMNPLVHVYAGAAARGTLPPSLVQWLYASGTAPFFAVLIAAFASGTGLVARALAWRPLVFLGEISFALYMCHQILFRALTANGTIAAFGALHWQYLVYWAMALGLSAVLFWQVEWPCRRAILNLLHADRRHPIAAREP